jgi:hypothetical protein
MPVSKLHLLTMINSTLAFQDRLDRIEAMLSQVCSDKQCINTSLTYNADSGIVARRVNLHFEYECCWHK